MVPCISEDVKIDVIEAVVVFVDISGFKQFINKNEKRAAEALAVFYSLLSELTINVPDNLDKIDHQPFSDCAYLWYEYRKENEDAQIKYLFEIVSELQYRFFIKYGLCIRGGINKGRLFLSRAPSGTSVNETYRMETEVAKWFRIAVSDEVVKLFHSDFDDYIYKDVHDEGCTVHFLNIMCNIRNDKSTPHEILSQYREQIVPVIYDEHKGQYFLNPAKEETLGAYVNSMRLLLKYQDLLLYFNLVCELVSCRGDIIRTYFVPNTIISKEQLDKHIKEYKGGSLLLINSSLQSLIGSFQNRR